LDGAKDAAEGAGPNGTGGEPKVEENAAAPAGACERKAELIKRIRYGLVDRLERLPEEKLQEFATDLAVFKKEWMEKHCPDVAPDVLGNSEKGGRR
jgi:hypothetical protein